MSELTRVVAGRTVPMAATWQIDGGHTSAAFAVRHLLTLMRGRFREVQGQIVIAENPVESTVAVQISAASIDTNNVGADDTLRGESFLNVETHPHLTFASTSVAPAENGHWQVFGDLTVAGTTRPVELDTVFHGAVTSPLGDGLRKMSLSATTTIARDEFGLGAFVAESPDTAGVLIIGRQVEITLDIEADLAS